METIHLSLFIMLCLGVHGSTSEILQRQKRSWIIDSFVIDEGYIGPFPYTLGRIQNEKNATFFRIHGQGVDLKPTGVLQIDRDTGTVTVHKAVDYEEFKIFTLTFQAIDREKHIIDTELGIEIVISDANDNAPTFDKDIYMVSIQESTVQGTTLITFHAKDSDTKENGIFDFKIISVTPKTDELEFYLTESDVTKTGTISFKGCLDHEKADKYTIIVEAKDHGVKKQLSSSSTIIINIEDGNNHLPVITGHTGPVRVKEGLENVVVSNVQVRDEDTRDTAAWRVKYKIQGDSNNNFRIATDPKTNDGLLYVEKHLDYEESSERKLTISVENEIPYSSCKLVRRTTTGLWETETSQTATQSLSIHQLTVTVEDVNEPPIFDISKTLVIVKENIKAGHYLTAFTARDPDSENTFVYRKGDDPADWVTVDPGTGKIITSKAIDRESSFVKDNIYNVTIYAVDNGKPPMTGTATLNINIIDENDNAPSLVTSTIDVCQSDGPSRANITAFDLDEGIYGGPFSFELLGNVDRKWRIEPPDGYSVNLVKEGTVHSGYYELMLGVSDLQHKTAVHNLSVTVCECLNPAKPNCRSRKSTGSTAGGGAIGIIFLAMLLLAVLLLLAALLTCKKEKIPMPDEGSGQHLMYSNTEKLGSDCKVAFDPINQGNGYSGEKIQITSQVPIITTKRSVTAGVSQARSAHTVSRSESLQQQRNYMYEVKASEASQAHSEYFQRRATTDQMFAHGNSMHWAMGASSSTGNAYGNAMHGISQSWLGHSKYSAYLMHLINHPENLLKTLNTRLYTLQAPGEELGDYAPHVYAEEDITPYNADLDAISISDISFNPDTDLDAKFSTLASICMPSESTAYTKLQYNGAI